MDYVIESRQKCMELLKDLRYNKYTQPVLRIVAPNFNFDTYKNTIDKANEKDVLDDFDDSMSLDSLYISNSSTDEVPVKVIKRHSKSKK